MEKEKTWWQRRGWIAVGGGALLLIAISAIVNGSNGSPQTSTANTVQASVSQATPIIGNDGKAIVDGDGNPLVFATSSIQELISNASSPAFENNVPGASGASNVSLTAKVVSVFDSKNGDFLISDGTNFALVFDSSTDPNTGDPSPVFQALSANVGKTVILYGDFIGGLEHTASDFQQLARVQLTASTPKIVGLAVYPEVGASPSLPATTQTKATAEQQTQTTAAASPAVQSAPAYQKIQLAAATPGELLDTTANLDVSPPVAITKDNGQTVYLMTVKDGNTLAALEVSKYMQNFGAPAGDPIEIQGTVSQPVSFCHGTDEQLAYWCGLMNLQDGDILIVPTYLSDLNPQHPMTAYSTHY